MAIIAVNGGSQSATPRPSLVHCAAASFKRAFSEGSEKSRYVQQILMWVVIHPAALLGR